MSFFSQKSLACYARPAHSTLAYFWNEKTFFAACADAHGGSSHLQRDSLGGEGALADQPNLKKVYRLHKKGFLGASGYKRVVKSTRAIDQGRAIPQRKKKKKKKNSRKPKKLRSSFTHLIIIYFPSSSHFAPEERQGALCSVLENKVKVMRAKERQLSLRFIRSTYCLLHFESSTLMRRKFGTVYLLTRYTPGRSNFGRRALLL